MRTFFDGYISKDNCPTQGKHARIEDGYRKYVLRSSFPKEKYTKTETHPHANTQTHRQEILN
jgi:hypothetical protein